MDFLKRIIAACRFHYEKLLLTLVLLGLGGAVLYLNKTKEEEEMNIKKFVTGVERSKPAPVKLVDFSANNAAIQLITNPPTLKFSLPHHLFNPVKWQRRSDGSLVKIATGDEIGWPKMNVTRIAPLNFIINLEKVAAPGSFYIGVTHEGAEKPLDRRKRQKFATKNSPKNEIFTLLDFTGPPEDPTELMLELADGQKKISISKDKPYTQVEGYEADLKYAVDGKTFTSLRVNSPLRFLGEDYIVVAITPNEVLVSARSNDKKYTVHQTTPP